ncbi:MBL fold metallo-hydrolase [Actinospica durhamensis]|uniref:MBL fold metallo-hydrolase n=1 Tax=Actinospica durhamensis TaxID=1508375 RepID=A0A941EWB2_9ACTN|nr:MBL fold metallo-hydrolase [Actinospica durhamensis]MBR7839450.1 MBL fold metallo-hydrolase [Actinospica durhamensis]
MQLTKHAHACVTLAKNGTRIVIDPGTFTPDAAEVVAAAEAVFITHEHFDHFDENVIARALEERSELRVYGPAGVVERWQDARHGQVTSVAEGDQITVGGFDIAVFGHQHARIHRDIPAVANVGYLIDANVYHPGDAYHVPPTPVETLLLPTSGPWTKVGEAADYTREVKPRRLIQIHEAMLSEIGQQSMTRFFSPSMLTEVPLTIVPTGETIALGES